jgi:hypothetical protein
MRSLTASVAGSFAGSFAASCAGSHGAFSLKIRSCSVPDGKVQMVISHAEDGELALAVSSVEIRDSSPLMSDMFHGASSYRMRV